MKYEHAGIAWQPISAHYRLAAPLRMPAAGHLHTYTYTDETMVMTLHRCTSDIV